MNSTFLNRRYQNPPQDILSDVCELANGRDDIINLAIGDPNFTTPTPIIDETMRKAKQGLTHYTATQGMIQFRQAIVNYYQQKYEMTITPDNVMVSVGVEHGLYILLQAILNPGDEVIIIEPFFSPYADQIEMAGGKVVKIASKPENGFTVDPQQIAAKISARTKAIIMNYPNNPTGALLSISQMKAIAQLAKDNNILIISDEIYADYTMPDKAFIPFAKLSPENTVTLNGMSKSFAMTGWRIGYLIGPGWLIKAVNLVNNAITFSAPTLSQVGATYAITHHDELVPPIVKTIQERLIYLEAAINNQTPFHVNPIGGGIYAFMDIRKSGLASYEFSTQLLKEQGILVVPGIAFGQAGDGFVRIAATQPLKQLKVAVNRLRNFKG